MLTINCLGKAIERPGKEIRVQKMMSVKYEILKNWYGPRGMKKRWTAKSADARTAVLVVTHEREAAAGQK